MDPIEEWTQAQQRVIGLVAGLSSTQAETVVPACPAWTVRDLLSHMIGLDADVIGGDEPDDHNAAWTQRQVDVRTGRDVATLLDEWHGLADPLREWMGKNGTRPLGDIVIHEQDLRGALGVPGAQATPGLHSLRDRMLGGFAKRVDGLAAITLAGTDWHWSSSGEADGAVVVGAADFDLIRALMSRRSEAQLRRWAQGGDIGPYLPAFGALGPLPDIDLTE